MKSYTIARFNLYKKQLPIIMTINIYNWCRKAILPVISTWLILNLISGLIIYPKLEGSSVVVKFWLALLPLHAGALAAAGVVLFTNTVPGERLMTLNLESPAKLTRYLKTGVLLAICFYPVNMIVTGVVRQLLKAMGYQPGKPPILEFIQQSSSASTIISLAVTALIIAPLAEEIIFRLILFESLSATRTSSPAIITALIFAVMHQTPVQIPALFLLGLVLQYVRSKYQSLWPSIMLHSAFNGISILLLLLILS